MSLLSKLLFGVGLLGLVLACPALSATLTGRVHDKETGKVLSGATVTLLELKKATPTDKYGVFEFKNIPDGHYTIVVSHVSYDHSDSLAIATGAAQPLNILLTPKPWVLNDVVVTATRSPHLLKNVPVQTEVVTERDFQRTGATSVDEALSSSIGINIDEDQAGNGATIRGIGGDRVLVLIDGERTVGRVKGNIDLGQIGLTNVKKIEVVKGTGSTLYGSDAMGGVINIITKDPSQESRRLSAYFDGGSFNTYNPSVDLDYGTPTFGLTLGGKYYATDGFDLIKETPHTNGQDAIKRLNLDSKARFELGPGWTLTTAARFMREKRNWTESELEPFFGDTLYITNDDEEDNNRYEGSVAIKHLSGDKYSMNLRAFGTLYDHDFQKVFESQYLVDESQTKDRFFELSYTANYMIGDGHMMTFGGDLNYQDLESTELLDGKQSNRAGDAYLQYEYSLAKTWTFLPGVRFESHEAFGNHVNPSLNVMYQPTGNVKLRGFVGYGFRAPSIKQQYFIFDHSAAGYIVYGGSIPLPAEATSELLYTDFHELTEETSLNSSISVEMSYGTIGLHRLTYFYNHLEDLIDFTLLGFPTIDGVDYWRGVYAYQNIEKAITQGIEWESRVRLSRNVDVSFSYNYLDARNLGTGEKLINRPAHAVKFFVTGYLERVKSGVTFWGNYHSSKLWVPRSNTGGNEGDPLEAPSRTTLNANFFSRLTPTLEAFLRFENITDQVEVDYGYWPGFSVYAGFKYDLSFER